MWKYVIARSTVVLVGIEGVHLALSAVVIICALDAITDHVATFVASVVVRFES